jgi:uncharacterized protein YkwD
MNYIDALLIVVMLLTIWSCIVRGFLFSAVELLTWAGSLILAFIVNKPLAALIADVLPTLAVWSAPITFVVSAIFIKLMLDLIFQSLLLRIPPGVHHHFLNKLLGIIPGIINGLLWAMFLSAFLLLLPLGSGIAGRVQESRLSNPLLSEATWLGQKFSVIFAEALNQSAMKMPARVGKEESIKLSFTVQKPQVRSDLEVRMLALVNMERKKHGLKSLTGDPEMTTVARKHSKDMFGRGYFSHISPEGFTPFDRMARDGVTFLTAGENLALAQTLTIAHNGLMKSPGHRANILNPAFGRLGIGILDGGIYGFMVTQNFRN